MIAIRNVNMVMVQCVFSLSPMVLTVVMYGGHSNAKIKNIQVANGENTADSVVGEAVFKSIARAETISLPVTSLAMSVADVC